MTASGGAFALREWLRAWNERLNRLEAYLRRHAVEPKQTDIEGPRPDDHWHRRN